jgi:hypothetical protein
MRTSYFVGEPADEHIAEKGDLSMKPAVADTMQPRMYARLPTGALLVPGVSPECSGPDAYRACSCVPGGAALPCAGATWHYRGADGTSWAFAFRSGSSVCPVAVLDPLGPLAVPGD